MTDDDAFSYPFARGEKNNSKCKKSFPLAEEKMRKCVIIRHRRHTLLLLR
jgi:hypothetical protein